MHDLVRGVPPALDLNAERALQELVVTLANERLIRSAHDCSDGGIAVTLAECAFGTGGIGAEISLTALHVARDKRINVAAVLFGETASRVVVSTGSDGVTEVLQAAARVGVPAQVIGETGGNRLRIAVAGEVEVDGAIDQAEQVWSDAIGRIFVRKVA